MDKIDVEEVVLQTRGDMKYFTIAEIFLSAIANNGSARQKLSNTEIETKFPNLIGKQR